MSAFHVPADAKSWVDYAPDCDFPIQNLPLGTGYGEEESGEVVVAPLSVIGDHVVHLWVLAESGLLPSVQPGDPTPWSEGVEAIRQIRRELFDLFRADNPILRDDEHLQASAMLPLEDVELGLPMPVTAFVDFYSGINHAANVGKMFRPDVPPLLPNYKHIPIGYNGRASTVIATEQAIHRPHGVQKVGEEVVFGPTQELDFELELGYFVVEGSAIGSRLSVAEAEEHIGGLVLVNDWSARDIQRFEYQPLGPFLAKSFATSCSPWMVSLDALAPFRIDGLIQDDPAPLPHLQTSGPGHFDIALEVWLQSAEMTRPQRICASNAKHLYWSIFQQLAHQTSNGTALESGDLYATGTISGEHEGTFGSMLELCWRGQKPLWLEETSEERAFLQDGDHVTLRAFAQGPGYRIGFGDLTTEIMGAG